MEITFVSINDVKKYSDQYDGLIDIYWQNNENEFGHIELHFYENGELEINSEYMGKEFVKKVFEKLIDNATLKE